MLIFLQKPDKQKSADAFVAVGEGMVFDDRNTADVLPVLQCLDTWIKISAAKGLHYTLQGAFKAVIFFIAEKPGGFLLCYELLSNFQLTLVFDNASKRLTARSIVVNCVQTFN